MKITNAQQAYELFLSCGMGFLLGLYYDVFRVIRLVMKPGAKTIFFQDLLFFVSSAVLTFLFSLSIMDGELRFYLFLGLIVGFVAYYFTIGKLVMKFAGAVVAVFLKAWHALWSLIFAPFRWLGKLLSRPMHALGSLLQFIPRKIQAFLKKGLKDTRSLLYNHKKNTSDAAGFDTERE